MAQSSRLVPVDIATRRQAALSDAASRWLAYGMSTEDDDLAPVPPEHQGLIREPPPNRRAPNMAFVGGEKKREASAK